MPEPDRVVVSDTGPFITLERLPGGFALLRQLYNRVLLPEQVLAELTAGRPPGDDYLQEFGLADLVEVVAVEATDPELAELDAGERDALSLALQRGLPLLIEERVGRDTARAKGVSYSGIAGQLMKARRLGLLSRAEAAEKLSTLFEAGRINRTLLDGLLAAFQESAGE